MMAMFGIIGKVGTNYTFYTYGDTQKTGKGDKICFKYDKFHHLARASMFGRMFSLVACSLGLIIDGESVWAEQTLWHQGSSQLQATHG